MKSILILLVIVFFPIIVCSQTVIPGGDVSGTWTLAGSPYLIEGDVNIDNYDTLVIEPGVIVEFQDNYGLFVDGQLIAIGNVTDSIVFTVNDTTGFYNYSHSGWKGIRFDHASQIDSSYLKYCIIEYGKGMDGVGGGLYIYYTHNLSVTNSVVQNCYIDGTNYSLGGGIAINAGNPFMRDVIVQNNYSKEHGGGMLISSETLDAKNITIKNNNAQWNGGGLYSTYRSETLFDFIITGNNASYDGGGIWSDSDMHFVNFEVYGNYAEEKGGGIYIDESTEIYNSTIHNNSALNGGGICMHAGTNGHSKIIDCQIRNNNAEISGGGLYTGFTIHSCLINSVIDSNSAIYGGGIYMVYSLIELNSLSIKNNNANFGGGLYINNDSPFSLNMDSVNLCSIYSNNGKIGKDLFSKASEIEIRVDTFTVQNPSDYYAMPVNNFSFNIVHGLSNLVNEDFYVAPSGSDFNSGLSSSDPFKTINHALSVLYTDDQNPATIFIEDGVYSPSNTGEIYPLTVFNNLTIQGSTNTILDADSTDRVLYSYSANSQVLNNLTLQNGKTGDFGGGMFLKYCYYSQLDSIKIYNCKAKHGGGIYARDSQVNFSNIVLMNNTAELFGGGLYIYGYNYQLNLFNALISHNSANKGGGVFTGGYPIFKNVSVFENSAEEFGGGIYNYSDVVIFDTAYRSNIYFNSAAFGNDLYNNCDSIMHIIVDTFTVLQPTSYHAKPKYLFDFDILNGKTEQISGDIYIAVDGDNNNSGLSWEEPLKTIRHGLMKSWSNESNPITMHLASGVYSVETNNEYLPIRPIDHFELIGNDEVIFDADSLTNILDIVLLSNVTIENIEIQNGYAKNGGGINIEDSQVSLNNLILTNNISETYGGGINIDNSQVSLCDLVVKNNISLFQAGGICLNKSIVNISNSIIDSNQAIMGTGGIQSLYSELNIVGSQFTGNVDENFTGGLILFYTKSDIINSTFSGNKTNGYWSGAIYAYDSVVLEVTNCVFWDEANDCDILAIGDDYQTYLSVSYSSLTDGENSISIGGNVELKYVANIAGDPKFIGNGMYPYQLDEFSPCIDMGRPDTAGLNLQALDLAGDPRIVNGRIDMGAFEWGTFAGVENHNLNKENLNVSVYPNPFTLSTIIEYKLETDNYVSIKIYNSQGRLISNLVNGNQLKGRHKVYWTPKEINDFYFCQIRIGDTEIIRRIIKLK